MSPNGSRFELIYLFGMDHEGRTSSKFTFVHKGTLVII